MRLALATGLPIAPVVSIGGEETALFLTRGERLARTLGLDRRFRLKRAASIRPGPPIAGRGSLGQLAAGAG